MTAFRLAIAADDALIRAVLRENSMETWVDMAVEREPSFFAGTNLFGRDWAVIATEGEDVVGMYSASVMPVHVDGALQRLGYLGGLRVVSRHRRRIRHLREGYASVQRLAPSSGTLPWWFTAVAEENRVARRLLESGVAGLPAYIPIGNYVMLGLPQARAKRAGLWRNALEGEVPALVQFHNAHASHFQLSPALDLEAVRRIGVENFFVHERAGELAGIAALWDQRAFKQIVARRYRAPIGALVPAYNAYARIFRRMPLPREGCALEQTFIAFLALSNQATDNGGALIRDLLSCCRTPVATLGLHAGHPLLSEQKALGGFNYRALLYAVSFDGRPSLSARAAQPEAALL